MDNASLYLETLLAVVGGLGVFLLGMRKLSDGLQTVAGPRLKKLVAMVTNNRLMAVGVGLAVTTVIQSSSITTVLVVGFVNSSIMTLAQAIGVIMGANIGTTITGWILVLDVGKYGLPLAGASSFAYIFSKRDAVRYTAMAILGIGLVFFGLEIMKDGLKPIRAIPEFKAMFHAFNADTYFGVLKCALVGCFLTMLVQSSSATLGITIAMASQGLIPFETAAALVLGENIGTTITALLASLGAGVNARRASYFHAMFNILGVAWITALFIPYLHLVEWVLQTFAGIQNVRATGDATSKDLFPYVTAGIAAMHSIFNVTNTIIFLPFAGVFAKILVKLVPDRASQSKRITTLDESMLESPFAAIEQVERELVNMCHDLQGAMESLATTIQEPENSRDPARNVFSIETRFDAIQVEVTEFLSDLMGRQIGSVLANDAQKQLRICDDLESVSDYQTQILKLQLRMVENEISYDEHQKESILCLHKKTASLFPLVSQYFHDPHNQILQQKILDLGHELTALVRTLRSEHWRSLANSSPAPLVSTTFSDMLVSYRKIKERLCSVTEAIAGIQ